MCDAGVLMSPAAGSVIPRSEVSVGLEPALRLSLAGLAAGRIVVIDYFASKTCSVVVGDLTCSFKAVAPGPGYLELAPIEGVPVFVEGRLLAILAEAGPILRMAGPPFARHLAIELEQPERWIDFLDGPGVLAGKRGLHHPSGIRG